MRIGFLADTHGNIDYLVLAAERLLGPLRAERVFFLGGNYADIDELFEFKKKLERGTEQYHDEHFLADVTDFLADAAGVGDGGGALAEYRKKFVRVPEPGAPEYKDEDVANKLLEMVGTNIVLLTYTTDDIVKDDLQNANIIFHGRLGKQRMVNKGNHYFVCPGHLRDKEHEGVPASFGLFELDNKEAHITFHGINGDVLSDATLKISKKGKISVQG